MARNRYIGLDYVRGISALSVAICHYLMRVDALPAYELIAAIAVEAFFPLSGFVLAKQITRITQTRRNLRVFLVRRWMRTIPPYIVALIAISVFLDQLFTREFVGYLFFINYVNPNIDVQNFYPVAWSLAIEEWYYILFPAFLIVMTIKAARRTQLLTFALMFVVFFLLVRLGLFYSVDSTLLRTGTFFRLDAIAIGFIFYIVFDGKKRYRELITILITSSVILLIYLLGRNSIIGPIVGTQIFLLVMPVFFGAFIVTLTRFEKIQNHYYRYHSLVENVGLWLGRISYSIYLFHLIIIYLFFSEPDVQDFPLFLLVLLTFCTVFYWLFEKPILEKRPHYKT